MSFGTLSRQALRGRPPETSPSGFDLPAPTLSLHLSSMTQRGLLDHHRAGRRVVYRASFAVMSRLMAFLMDNCCGGLSGHCEPAVAVAWVTDTATREPEIIGNE